MLKEKIVSSMVKNQMIESDEFDVYCFGVQLLLETVFSFVIFLIIAALFNSIFETIIFIVSFAVLRQYAGGYHASKFIYCLTISCLIIIGFCCFVDLLKQDMILLTMINVLSILIILFLSPTDSKYKPIPIGEKAKYKKKLLGFLTGEVVAVLILCAFSINYSVCITYSWYVLSALLVAGKIQNRRYFGKIQ